MVQLLLRGQSNGEIATSLRTSRKSVDYHLSKLYRRFGVATRVELAVLAVQNGWEVLDDDSGVMEFAPTLGFSPIDN